MPAVTILLPARNAASTIGPAIRSLQAQTFADWQVLMLDDGSTDSTADEVSAIRDKRIRVIHDGRSLGVAARLNQAIELSEGEYVARMDADDIAYPSRLARQVEFLQSHPAVDVVGTWMCVFRSDGTPLGLRRPGPEQHAAITASPAFGIRLAHPTLLGKTAWFKSFKYNPSNRRAEDQDLYLRSHRESCFANIPDILIGYREDRLRLRKLALTRWCFLRALYSDCSRQGHFGPLAPGILGQVVRFMLDTCAVTTGLQHRLAPQRAQPLTAEQIAEWRELYRDVVR